MYKGTHIKVVKFGGRHLVFIMLDKTQQGNYKFWVYQTNQRMRLLKKQMKECDMDTQNNQ